MKKSVFMAVAIASVAGLVNVAKAQTAQVASVKVKVELKDVIGVGNNNTVAPGSLEIGFLLETANDYSQDKVLEVPSQFTVTSSKAYDVVVKANAFTGTDANGQTIAAPISTDVLQVRAKAAGKASYGAAVALSTTDQTLVKDANAGINQLYDIQYTLTKTSDLLAATKGTYTTNVIYSVTAK